MIPFDPIPTVLTSVELYEMYAARHGQVSQVLFDHKFEVVKTRKPYTNIYSLSYSVAGMNLPRVDFRIRLYEALSKLRSEVDVPQPEIPKPTMRDMISKEPISPDEVRELSAALSELHKLLGEPAVHSDTEIVNLACASIRGYKWGLGVK